MKTMKYSFLIAAVIFVSGFSFCQDINNSNTSGEPSTSGGKKDSKKDKEKQRGGSDVTVVTRWDLPKELQEVSGIAYLDNNRFACVQDEKGVIFIYNANSKTIEKQVPFAGAGDYEGIAVNGNTAYVVTADGELYEVNMSAGASAVKQYKTALTGEHNVEGLTYDRKHNRLLLAIKNDEPGDKDYKGIYAFDLARKSFINTPVYKIDLNHELLASKGKKNNIMPSEIGIHPQTGELYITDGPNARLLVMSPGGEISKLLDLGKSFEQPEGITFSPQGEVFISNEGSKEPGNILKVEVE
jgi:uncharacterized protein YjiK